MQNTPKPYLLIEKHAYIYKKQELQRLSQKIILWFSIKPATWIKYGLDVIDYVNNLLLLSYGINEQKQNQQKNTKSTEEKKLIVNWMERRNKKSMKQLQEREFCYFRGNLFMRGQFVRLCVARIVSMSIQSRNLSETQGYSL